MASEWWPIVRVRAIAHFEQALKESYPYFILDARYERAREAGVIASQAVLVAIGVHWESPRRFWRGAWQRGKPIELARIRGRAMAARARRRRVRRLR
nr:transposase [Mesorhizobium abyssinicae]